MGIAPRWVVFDAYEMSARRVQVGGGDWLKWAGSAYELDGSRNK
ncbi:hypothetical protein [Moorella stamsii]|nr:MULTISPECIES: hypothetical protein [Moorella]